MIASTLTVDPMEQVAAEHAAQFSPGDVTASGLAITELA
jgi:hypothetical protein